VAYLKAAQGLVLDSGLRHLPSHWPPAYPLYVAALAHLLPSVKLAALYGQALLLVCNGCLFALIVFRYLGENSRGRQWTALGAGVFFLTSPYVFLLHQYALSEALFIFFLLAGIPGTLWFLRKRGGCRLVLAALLVGCLPVTRYAGMLFVPVFGVMVYLHGTGSQKYSRRLATALAFTAIACLPLLAWLGLNMGLRGESTNREIAFHPVGWAHLEKLAAVFLGWFELPGSRISSVLAMTVIIGSIVWSSLDTRSETTRRQLTASLFIASVLYIVFIFFSISFIDANTLVDQRILLPAWLLLYLAAFLSTGESLRIKPLYYAALVSLLSIGASGLVATGGLIRSSVEHGLGYHTPDALRSDLLAQVRTATGNVQIYSNAGDYIYLNAGREVRSLPRIYNPGDMHYNPRFLADMTRIVKGVDEGTAVIVYFKDFGFRTYFPTLQQLEDEFFLGTRRTFSDGAWLSVWQDPSKDGRVPHAAGVNPEQPGPQQSPDDRGN